MLHHVVVGDKYALPKSLFDHKNIYSLKTPKRKRQQLLVVQLHNPSALFPIGELEKQQQHQKEAQLR